MANYIIGDLQGCLTPVMHLLERVEFDFATDCLYLAGDIVNRGGESLQCLEFVLDHQKNVKMVLGNHDLHLLAVVNGTRKASNKDTFEEILQSPRLDEFCQYLYKQPLVMSLPKNEFGEAQYMSHAGLPPMMSAKQALAYSAELTIALADETKRAKFFAKMYGDKPALWQDDLTGNKRLRCITNYFTRMRFTTFDGELDLNNKGDATSADPNFLPWFQVPREKEFKGKWYFGHWAALNGKSKHDKFIAMDAGYIWGGRLKMMNLKNGKTYFCDQNGRVNKSQKRFGILPDLLNLADGPDLPDSPDRV